MNRNDTRRNWMDTMLMLIAISQFIPAYFERKNCWPNLQRSHEWRGCHMQNFESSILSTNNFEMSDFKLTVVADFPNSSSRTPIKLIFATLSHSKSIVHWKISRHFSNSIFILFYILLSLWINVRFSLIKGKWILEDGQRTLLLDTRATLKYI